MTSSEDNLQMEGLPQPVLIRGAGDLATGVAHRLILSGFSVIMLELPQPLVVRRSAAFADAVYREEVNVEGVIARLCFSVDEAIEYSCAADQKAAILVDSQGSVINVIKPPVLIDAMIAKKNLGTSIGQAPLVIALGPGFYAGKDVHAVIETNRGPDLGRVIFSGTAEIDTGRPGMVGGFSEERLLRAPAGGIFKPLVNIGDMVNENDLIATVGPAEIRARIGGLVRGLLYPGLTVSAKMKVGDIDPRGKIVNHLAISDKARAIGGGVLEAILHYYFGGAYLYGSDK